LLSVLRYIERNPLRAEFVERAERWGWSSLRWWRERKRLKFLHVGPVPRGRDWLDWVNQPMTEADLIRLRRSVARSRMAAVGKASVCAMFAPRTGKAQYYQ